MPRPRVKKPRPARRGGASLLAFLAFAAVYALATALWRVPAWVGWLYVAASGVCFLVYAIDKSAAGAGGQRISEATLILLGLAGGWPGAVVAQQTLRHKSSKLSFLVPFWGSVALNVAAFVAISALWPAKAVS